MNVLCDPQTSGGLLIACAARDAERLADELAARGRCWRPASVGAWPASRGASRSAEPPSRSDRRVVYNPTRSMSISFAYLEGRFMAKRVFIITDRIGRGDDELGAFS